MATNKNQHFVPKVYLRPFTKDGAGRAINVFNTDREELFPNAPVKGQCAGNYFYGEDPTLERAIHFFETSYGTVVQRLERSPAALCELDKNVLRRFWLLQYLRTEAAATRSVEMFARMGTDTGMDLHEFRLNIRDAVRMAMRTCAETMILGSVDDLSVCVLRNHTNTPFITSDDPAIGRNRWHERFSRSPGGVGGFRSAGFIFLLPISPRLLCLGYDRDVYSVVSKAGFANVTSIADVERLNTHQYLNCRANLYVHSQDDVPNVAAGYRAIKAERPQARWKINYAVQDNANAVSGYGRFIIVDPAHLPDRGNVLIHTQAVYPTVSAWPNLLRWHMNGQVFTNGTGVGYVRRAYAEAEGGFWKEPAKGKPRTPRREKPSR